MIPSEVIAQLAVHLGCLLRDSPFPNRIIRWWLKDGTYIEAKKIQHKIQKVYWSKLDDSWDTERSRSGR